MHPSLRTFLDLLNRENEIVEIKAEVDPYLEVAEIHRRVINQGGPALLFSRVKGSRYPVVTNLFGTNRRIDLAFGPKPERLVRELVNIAESILPPKPTELWKHKSVGLELLRLGTANTSRSPVTQVMDSTSTSRSVTGTYNLAGRWWTLFHIAAGLHRKSSYEET
jgi:UbiD family decarboxylase